MCVFRPEVAIPALNAYKFNLVFCGTSSPASVALVVLSCFVILFVLSSQSGLDQKPYEHTHIFWPDFTLGLRIALV